MVGAGDCGKRVVVRAADDEYKFIDGWEGILSQFEAGYAVVLVANKAVDIGYMVFYIPPDQVVSLEG